MNTMKVLRALVAVTLIVVSLFTWHVISEYEEEYTDLCESTCMSDEVALVSIEFTEASCRCVVPPDSTGLPGAPLD